MSERLPDNLATLYSAYTREAIESLFTGEIYEVDGVEFVCKYAPESTPERFCIVKPLRFVEYFVDYCRQFRGGSIFELGIAEGGSTALLAIVAEPEKLVAVDLEPQRLDALDTFIAQRGLTEVVHPYYGIDQADQGRLHEIVQAEFNGDRLDLVLDDASHDLGFTRSSFEALFPYLRPGGMYTIEDWNSDNRYYDAVVAVLRDPDAPGHDEAVAQLRGSMAAAGPTAGPKRPLCQLAVELVLACASSTDVVAEVAVNEHWIMVRRGEAEIDPASFSLAGSFRDYFGFLPAETESAR